MGGGINPRIGVITLADGTMITPDDSESQSERSQDSTDATMLAARNEENKRNARDQVMNPARARTPSLDSAGKQPGIEG
jgi:hypothetical protein